MTTDEARSVLVATFGPEWEMYLLAEGVVGGDTDDTVEADRQRVAELARRERPDFDDDWHAAASDAWFILWTAEPA